MFPAFDGKATLEDQFGREKVRVRTANRFCNPVSKNDQGIFDEGGHLLREELWVVKARDWTMKVMLLQMLEWHAVATSAT